MPLIRSIAILFAAAGVSLIAVACGDTSPRTPGDTTSISGSAGRDTAPAPHQLRIATAIDATIQDSITSRRNKVGDRVAAIVSRHVVDDSGRVVIPAGAVVALRVAALHRAAATSAEAAVVALDVVDIRTGTTTYAVVASAGHVGFRLRPGGSPSADRELVVTAGTPITIRLTDALRIATQ